jgi:uncharacterized protein YacL
MHLNSVIVLEESIEVTNSLDIILCCGGLVIGLINIFIILSCIVYIPHNIVLVIVVFAGLRSERRRRRADMRLEKRGRLTLGLDQGLSLGTLRF